MPLPSPEPLPTIILMRVDNPRAPRAGDTGRIVDTEGEGDGLIVVLEFEDKDRRRYARCELTVVMP